MSEHRLSPTTHTLDMVQVAQLDARLKDPHAPAVTAADVDVTDEAVAPSAPLRTVWLEGPPEFPYLYADFEGPGGAPVHVQLHTPNLVRLSHRLGLHHRWGV